MTIPPVTCINCGRIYPASGIPYCCPICGGLYDLAEPLTLDPSRIDPSQPGIWRYRHTFGLGIIEESISLGEGNTPLIWTEVFNRQVAFKCEYQNPTGSFKDRGSATLVSSLLALGAIEAVEDSSGNAGASFAAYAARAGIRCRIFIPEAASGLKRQQIASYGAEVIDIPGPRMKAAEAVRQAADTGITYASHAYMPFNIPGYATLAYELYDILGCEPAAIIMPVGQGGLLLGVGRGLQALVICGLLRVMPKIIGVQAKACAPLWAMVKFGGLILDPNGGEETIAEGVRVRYPLRGDAVIQMVKKSGGWFVAVEEAHILRGQDQLAQRGFYVEPTSAIVWQALEDTLPVLPDPVVVVLTGSGFKHTECQSSRNDVF